VASHRSDGIVHPADGLVAAVFAAALLCTLTLLTAGAARRPAGERRLVLASLAAVAAFAALGKVLSPQFALWLVPLGALALAWRMHALAGCVAAVIALTLVEFPSRYFDLVDREPLPLAIVALRNAALLGALVLVARELLPAARRLGARGPARAAAR
jgi:MFS family permease